MKPSEVCGPKNVRQDAKTCATVSILVAIGTGGSHGGPAGTADGLYMTTRGVPCRPFDIKRGVPSRPFDIK